MKIRYLIPSMILVLMVTACDRPETQTGPRTVGDSNPMPPSTSASPEVTPQVATTISKKPVAAKIGPTQSASGKLLRLKQGQISAISFKIGNYSGKSDGSLQLKACSSGMCSTGTADLAASENNKGLRFVLNTPLPVSKDAVLEWTLTRIGATNDVAVWTYPIEGKSEGMTLNGTPLDRSPRVTFEYQ